MTEQANHTPGPWAILYPEQKPQLVFAHGNNYELVVANCGMSDEGISTNAVIANARLIAAAPEMAGELKLCLRRFEALTEDCYPLGAKARRQEDIRAVLQKAGVLDGEI